MQGVSESLRLVFSFNKVCACCGMLHNSDYDLRGTECECTNRLWLHEVLFKISIHHHFLTSKSYLNFFTIIGKIKPLINSSNLNIYLKNHTLRTFDFIIFQNFQNFLICSSNITVTELIQCYNLFCFFLFFRRKVFEFFKPFIS